MQKKRQDKRIEKESSRERWYRKKYDEKLKKLREKAEKDSYLARLPKPKVFPVFTDELSRTHNESGRKCGNCKLFRHTGFGLGQCIMDFIAVTADTTCPKEYQAEEGRRATHYKPIKAGLI